MSHFIIDIAHPVLSLEEKRLFSHPNVGGALLFSRNFQNRSQLEELIRTVRAIRPDLWFAVDHEGGFVQRFQRHGFRALPAARVFGDIYDENPDVARRLAKKYGQIMASQLKDCGISVSFAPVLDLDGENEVIGHLDRAFHSDPEAVFEISAAYIQGMHDEGMPAVGKHFPGHGKVKGDSHLQKPTRQISLDKLLTEDLHPFVKLIKQDKLDAIMPAHITFTDIDSNPVTFSKTWLQIILRQQLNFEGLIISDCLSMAGADLGSLEVRTKKALEAGCDMLIVCNQPPHYLWEILDIPATAATIDRIEAFKQKTLTRSCRIYNTTTSI